MSLNSATSSSFSSVAFLGHSLHERRTGSVGKPSRSDATSTHHTSPFFAANSNVSTSAAGKNRPSISQGSVIFCASACWLLGSASAILRQLRGSLRRHENELTRARRRLARRGPGAGLFEQGQAIEVLGPALERQAVDLDEVLAVGRGLEVQQAAAAIDQQVAALRIGDDQHRRQLRVDARAPRSPPPSASPSWPGRRRSPRPSRVITALQIEFGLSSSAVSGDVFGLTRVTSGSSPTEKARDDEMPSRDITRAS